LIFLEIGWAVGINASPMSFESIFSKTAQWLEDQGLAVEIQQGECASQQEIVEFNERFKLKLPMSFSRFFTEFADGYSFSWEKTDEVWGQFIMPALNDLNESQEQWAEEISEYLDDPQTPDLFDDDDASDEGMAILKRMKFWVPFYDEGNGDHFALDTKSGAIVYDQHDWMDGFGSLATTNGIGAGKDLEDFLNQWSRFGFRRNESQWWGSFADQGKITWDPSFFESDFVRPAG